MRWISTILCLLFLSSNTYSQKLTGIWRGYFIQKNFNQLSGRFVEEKYKYEIQINQLTNNSLEGVTYSYKTTVFYLKASFHGIYTRQTKNVLIKEIKMLEIKMADLNNTCAMTCYLDYAMVGKLESLSGTFTSINTKTKTDCGEGTVYLEKVLTTDFVKERFLLKKETGSPSSAATINKKKSENSKQNRQINKPKEEQTTKKSNPAIKPSFKPGTEDFIVPQKSLGKARSSKNYPNNTHKPDTTIIPPLLLHNNNKEANPKVIVIPKVLIERDNNLMKTIQLSEKDVQIDYYDNGEIDNDTITVYHNNQLVINHGRLSYSPITLRIHLDEAHPIHEIITVADNLGDIPPNTALMVITAGKKRYEVAITSDEKTNAKVILEYKPEEVKVH
jgi:hypothetical protein